MIVAYDSNQSFMHESAEELQDYYFTGSSEVASEVILMSADTRLGDQAG